VKLARSLPNALTLLRLVLAPLIAWLLLHRHDATAFVLFLVAAVWSGAPILRTRLHGFAARAAAGVAVDGSVLDVRQSLNDAYYRQGATPIEILVKRSVSSPGAAGLRAALAKAST
jgi:hypothetical protein